MAGKRDQRGFVIRSAATADTPALLEFIRKAAAFHELAASVHADEASLRRTLFGESPYAFALLAEMEETDGLVHAGFCVWYFKYSSYKAKPSLYVEDLFVESGARGRGIGTALMRRMAQIAQENDCHSMEWVTPSSDSNAALRFYRSIGAEVCDTIKAGSVYHMRLLDQEIEKLAREEVV